MLRFVLAVLLVVLTACTATPADPEGTLDRVRGGTIRAGITENDPWTRLQGDEPVGVEVRLLEDFAEELDATISWTDGSEAELLGALELGELDVVVGGFAPDSPWSQYVAFTHPYFTSQIVVAVPAGEPIPPDIAGIEVSVEEHTEQAGTLEKTDAVPVPVADVTQVEGPVAIEHWLLDDLELQDTGVTLVETDHSMALRLGENGWMVTLERYLLGRSDDVNEMLSEESL